MADRRKFLKQCGLVLGASAVTPGKLAVAESFEQSSSKPFEAFEDYQPTGVTGLQTTPETFQKSAATQYTQFVAHENPFAVPADVIVGISQAAINKFLSAHFTDNPNFYDRGRDKKSPIYQHEFDDHGTKRTFKFFGKVQKDSAKPPLFIDLSPPADRQTRYQAFWRARSNVGSGGNAPLPPNVELTVPHCVLQIDFPRLGSVPAGADPYHHLDLNYLVSVRAYVNMEQDIQGKTVLTLTDWDILLTSLDDPLSPPATATWGQIPSGCEPELSEARLALRDIFTLGANIALTDLCKTLTRAIALPPVDIVHGATLVPRQLYVADGTLAVSATLSPEKQLAATALQRYEVELRGVQEEVFALDMNDFAAQYPSRSVSDFHAYALAASPAYASLVARNNELVQELQANLTVAAQTQVMNPLPQNDLFVMLSGKFFDQLARNLLTSDEHDCTPWKELSIVVAYLRGRGCYWFDLTGAHGLVSGTTVSMGCDVNAGGKLDLQACVHVPCRPDLCATWSPGIGLSGPLRVSVSLINLSWKNNSALLLHPQCNNFPGLDVYGFFDPVIGDVVNFILNFISGIAFTALCNAILGALNFPLIQIPITVPKTNVKIQVGQLGAANINGMLTVTGTTTFN